MYIGNVLLLILNIPLIGIWVRILSIPYSILYPAMLGRIRREWTARYGDTKELAILAVTERRLLWLLLSGARS
jgi:TctA family transporter